MTLPMLGPGAGWHTGLHDRAGTMATPIFQSASEELKQRLVANVQFPKRMGRPEEYALLVSDRAECVPQWRSHTPGWRPAIPA